MRVHALIALTLIAESLAISGVANADEAFSVVINGRTGQTVLRNDGPNAVNLDGYLLRSPLVNNAFNPVSWSSLQDNAVPGWLESHSAGNRLGEANLFGSTAVAPGATLNIGSPYLPFVPAGIGETEPGLDSINFTYSVAGIGVFDGDVEFISRNTLVLAVNPITGAASLQNQSAFNINLDSYLIRSPTAVIDVAGWTPLEQSLGPVGGWSASSGAANRIAEGNLFGSTFLAANGGTLSLGAPIDPDLLDDETDLELEFTVVGLGAIPGGVRFTAAAAPGLAGDYNGNGTVDAADYVLFRNGGPLLNEGITPGAVTIEDYNFWRARFGMTAGSGSGSLQAAALSVPEPGVVSLVVMCLAAFAARSVRCRRPLA